jgi:hypothetical protein
MRCSGRTSRGQCRAAALSNSKFCFFHSPEFAKYRRAAQRTGGKHAHSARVCLPPMTSDVKLTNACDIANLVSETISATRRGELDVKVASTIGYLSSVALNALDVSASSGPTRVEFNVIVPTDQVPVDLFQQQHEPERQERTPPEPKESDALAAWHRKLAQRG